MFSPKAIKAIPLVVVFLFPQTRLLAQTDSEVFAAAVRLKMAHVRRSYERCIDIGKTDAVCRAELDALHPRELTALGRFASLSSRVPDVVLSTTMSECYDPSRDYKELIECWENTASNLEVAYSQEPDPLRDTEPSQINSDDLQSHIINQLQCVGMPDPIFTFLALEKIGKIEISNRIGYDGISCFEIDGGFEIEGMVFTSVCGYVRDSLEQQLFSEFFWRGPGTAPEQFISFGAQTSIDGADFWYRNVVSSAGPKKGVIRAGNGVLGEAVQIRCGF